MAKVLDAIIPGVAKTLLEQFGTDVTLRLVTPGVLDPATRTTTGETEADVPAQAVLEKEARFQESEDGTLRVIRQRKATVWAAGLPRSLKPQDRLLVGSDEHEIVEVNPIYSGDSVAVFELKVRR